MNTFPACRKTTLFAGALAISSLAIMAPAAAEIKNGQEKVKLVVSGHVNKAVLFADDGNTSRTLIVDNGAATTRLNFLAEAPVTEDFSFGAQFEFEYSSNNSGIVTLHEGNGGTNRANTTPTYGGFFASGSFTSGGPGEAALRYSGKLGPFELAAALGYANLSGINTTVDDQVVGSASILHESGLNASFSAGKRNHKAAARDDGKSIYGKIGYIAKVFGVGPTAFGIDYGVYDDYGQNNDEAKTYSIGAVQHFDDIGSQVYLLGKAYELDRTGTSYDDIRLLMVGARVAF